tara:strand:- start:503 stop:1093 length:591 start_codon:yes stop_codon:yes gene_type:complete
MFVNILSRSLAGNRPYKTPSSFILRTIALDFTEFFTAASSLNSINCAVKNSSKLLYFFPLAFKHPVLISYDNPFSKVLRTSFLRRNFPSSSNNRSCADDAIEDAFEASPPPNPFDTEEAKKLLLLLALFIRRENVNVVVIFRRSNIVFVVAIVFLLARTPLPDDDDDDAFKQLRIVFEMNKTDDDDETLLLPPLCF